MNFELVIDRTVNWEQTNDIEKMNLYRILQEACQNINKHSEAQKANIHFFIEGYKLCLTIADDGIGITPNKPKKGIGLKNDQSHSGEIFSQQDGGVAHRSGRQNLNRTQSSFLAQTSHGDGRNQEIENVWGDVEHDL